MTAIRFIADIPHYAEDSNNGQLYLVADIVVYAIAYHFNDGSMKGVDIETLIWKGGDVTSYVCDCCPGTWDRIKEAARLFYIASPKNTCRQL